MICPQCMGVDWTGRLPCPTRERNPGADLPDIGEIASPILDREQSGHRAKD